MDFLGNKVKKKKMAWSGGFAVGAAAVAGDEEGKPRSILIFLLVLLPGTIIWTVVISFILSNK